MEYRNINQYLMQHRDQSARLEVWPTEGGAFWGWIKVASADAHARRFEQLGATMAEVMDKIEAALPLAEDARLDWVSPRYARLRVGDARVGYLQETEATEGIPAEWVYRIQRDYGGGTYSFGTDRRACIVAALAKLDYIEERVIL